jgi:hypothetical protein
VPPRSPATPPTLARPTRPQTRSTEAPRPRAIDPPSTCADATQNTDQFAQSSLKIVLKDPKYDPLTEVVVKIGSKKVADIKGVKTIKKGIVLKKVAAAPLGAECVVVVALAAPPRKLVSLSPGACRTSVVASPRSWSMQTPAGGRGRTGSELAELSTVPSAVHARSRRSALASPSKRPTTPAAPSPRANASPVGRSRGLLDAEAIGQPACELPRRFQVVVLDVGWRDRYTEIALAVLA